MMIKVKSFIKGIDQFSNEIGLHMNNSYQYRTTLGGCLTILSFTFILLFFLSKMTSFYLKESVNVVVNSRYNPNPPRSYMNSNRFMFAVQIEQKDFLTNPFFNITVYQKIFKNQPNTSTKTIQEYEIELEPCTPAHWRLIDSYANFTQLYLPFGFDYLCPSMDSVMFVEGMYGSDVFSFFQVVVSQCVTPNDPKRKWNPVCAPQDIIDTYTNENGYQGVSFYHSNYALNVDQPQDFFTPFINDRLFFTFVPYKMTRNCDIYFQDITVANEESIYFGSDRKVFQFPIQQSNDYREITELGRSDGRFAVLTVRLNPYVTEINRSYKKFTELLSELGGFTHLIMASLGIIVRRYNLFQLTIELANKLYQSDKNNSGIKTNTSRENKKNRNRKSLLSKNQSQHENLQQGDPSSIFSEINKFNFQNPSQIQQNELKGQNLQADLTLKTTQKESYSPELTTNINLKSKNAFEQFNIKLNKNPSNDNYVQDIVLEQKDNKTQEEKQQVKKQKQCFKCFNFNWFQKDKNYDEQKSDKQISIFKYMIYYLFSKYKIFSKEGQLVTQAVKMVNQSLDVINIHKKMQEVDKLKNVIFDKHQKRLFEFIPAPQISCKDSQNSDDYLPIQGKSPLINEKTQIQPKSFKDPFVENENSQLFLYDSYLQVKRLQDLAEKQNSSVNQRLINHLGKEILQDFQSKEADLTQNAQQLNLFSESPLTKFNSLNQTPLNNFQKRSLTFLQNRPTTDKKNHSFSQFNLNTNYSQNFQAKKIKNQKSINSVTQAEVETQSMDQDSEVEQIRNEFIFKRQIPEENTDNGQIFQQLQNYQKQRILINKEQNI
ncbi:transmembrane protein, putative (macronuclear) [Tetrahymena thermophila SB210]|uniref:Transmembrane protein, putative n=1 Tax=Tetrahymena thermophila (strain SB210) TaxID=312017 RepID=Q22W73_TETTS|nr:transmembrane protein, putative [Tetrahymena thermophila SB210]EAR89544.2 transmembrane protein, putative [Tetrahymena thermophila SB210]|eukprot:XP_001009789.2 transmembrane protein, putative [Tetrahymena thermophila SB210]